MMKYVSIAVFYCACFASLAHLSVAAPLLTSQASSYTLQVTARYPASKLANSQALFLRGDSCGLSWSEGIELLKVSTEADTWSIALHCDGVAASIISMKVLVDDNTWSLGCNMHASAGAPAVVLFPWFYATSGHYEYIRSVYSPQLGNSRDIVVYLPPSYTENILKNVSNLLVMHDGQNLFNESTSAFGCWHCDKTADANIIAGSVEEVAIIGVDNSDDRTNELTYSYDASQEGGGKGDKYLDFVEHTVLAAVRSRYRVSSTAGIAMAGSSLGGLITCYAAATRPTVWANAACMSSSFWCARAAGHWCEHDLTSNRWNSQDFINSVLPAHAPPPSSSVYVDSGDSGPDKDDETQTKAVYAALQNTGARTYYYLDVGGEHSEKYWGARFWRPLQFLFPAASPPSRA